MMIEQPRYLNKYMSINHYSMNYYLLYMSVIDLAGCKFIVHTNNF